MTIREVLNADWTVSWFEVDVRNVEDTRLEDMSSGKMEAVIGILETAMKKIPAWQMIYS